MPITVFSSSLQPFRKLWVKNGPACEYFGEWNSHEMYWGSPVQTKKIVLDAQLCCLSVKWIKPGIWFSSDVFCWHETGTSLWSCRTSRCCELLKKLLRENPFPWHPRNPAWLYSPLLTLWILINGNFRKPQKRKNLCNKDIANGDDAFETRYERNCRYVRIFKQLHSCWWII